MEIDPQSVKYGFDALRAAVEAVKSLTENFGGGSKSDPKIDEQIKAAERQVQLAEAQLAQSLQYKLCRAHFPPVPMLKNRVDAKRVIDIHRCPICGLEEPSVEYFTAENRKEEAIQRARQARKDQMRIYGRI